MAKSRRKLVVAQKPDGTIVEAKASGQQQAEVKKAYLEGAGYSVEIFDFPESEPEPELTEVRVPPAVGATAAMIWGAVGLVLVVGGAVGGLVLLRAVNHRFGVWGALITLGAAFLVLCWAVMYASLSTGAEPSKRRGGGSSSHGRLGGRGASGYVVRRGFYKGIR